MPYAQAGSMATWLKSPAPLTRGSATWENDSFLRHHVRTTMLGLVSALAYIHREINGMIGFHHDIKPDNIILFVDPKLVWKICDFGTANLKDPKEGTGTACTTANYFGTYTYRPPEYFIDQGVAMHGRAFDVYSLGCVMLELATVFTYGWKPEGLTAFQRKRQDASKRPYSGNLKPPIDISFHNSPEVVKSWIEHLKNQNQSVEDSNGVSDIVPVLDIISEMLMSRYERIFAWEVEMDLYEIFNPHASVDEQAERLRNIVQPSVQPLDQTKEQHNPMRRAISHSKRQWYTEILQGRDWNYSARSLSRRSARMLFDLDHSNGRPCTNLGKTATTQHFRSAHFFGRHVIHEKIISGFQRHNTVIGLYGKSGVGKSHSAYYYASGFQDPKDPQDRKHTLWVDSKDWNSITGSFWEILSITGAPRPTERDTLSIVTSLSEWLEEAKTGPWIMVLDGLEDEDVADKLNQILPISDGEILITTKNKIILTKFFDVNSKDCFIRMGDLLPLPDLTASYIFDSHINRDLITNTESRDFLVERLPLPALIISMAKHMNRTDYTTQTLQEDECSGANHTIEQQYSDFSKRLLSPLLPSLPNSNTITGELNILGEMSCLNHTRIEFTLLQQVHTKPDELQSYLSTLEQCSLISMGENRVYSMQHYVQVAVLQWFQIGRGDERILQLHATALRMLYKQYIRETQKRHRKVNGKSRVPSRLWKLPYKPHFDRFLEYARKNTAKAKSNRFLSYRINGIDVMVAAIVTFSKLYLEEHRYDDAICVLEFVDAIYDGHERRYELKRLLIRAYFEKPLRDEYNDKWDRIFKLSRELIDEAVKSKNMERKWALVLDLTRFYSESHQPDKALRELNSLWMFKLNVEDGEAKLDIKMDVDLNRFKKQELAVQWKVEEGRVNFVDAKLRMHQGFDKSAAKRIQTAISCWQDAIRGIASWQLDYDEEWTWELKEMIADAYIDIGKQKELEEAEEILEHLLQRRIQAPDHENADHAAKRRWDIECKKANAWIKRGDEHHRKRAIELLRNHLQKYENIYGGQDACTRNCAYLLRWALSTDSQKEEVQQLEQKYQLRKMSAVRVDTAERSGQYLSLSHYSLLLILATYILGHVLDAVWGKWSGKHDQAAGNELSRQLEMS
ncbi:hypothetical protein DE146DRAFT_418243 [Phaeosphaeria sp. MPI-PUGE-AT-0046c]|nr:hypothetical protein DE146DRAFT_418243 [Phaeosphaeria sp. MPI-PUGE-AT-0046c]